MREIRQGCAAVAAGKQRQREIGACDGRSVAGSAVASLWPPGPSTPWTWWLTRDGRREAEALRKGYVVGRKIGGRGSRGGPYLWLVDRADLLEKQSEWERDGYPWVRM